uniref:histidine kinase n=1 Tax=Streptococcus canis TaxID=1329 RepID=UPI0024AC9CA0|nr:histidine kinase [Streptococcus canis]
MLEEFLQFLGFLFLDIIEIVLMLKLFSFISAIPFRFKKIFYLGLAIVLFQVVVWTFLPDYFTVEVVMMEELLFFVLIALYYGRPIKPSLLVFYGLFPMVVTSLIKQFIVFFIAPLFGLPFTVISQNTFLSYGFLCFSIFLAYFFVKLYHYDFSSWHQNLKSVMADRLLLVTNGSMFLYYLLLHGIDLSSLNWFGMTSTTLRQIIVIFYLILFLTLLAILDRKVKQHLLQQNGSVKRKKVS